MQGGKKKKSAFPAAALTVLTLCIFILQYDSDRHDSVEYNILCVLRKVEIVYISGQNC